MLPEGWTTTEVGKLATFKSGGTPSKMNTDYWGGSYPWISGKDLKQHYLASSIDTLTKAGFESTNVAPIGSSLILVRGMTLLKDFPVGFATRPVAFNQDIKALIPNEDVDGLFLSYLLVAHKDEIRQLVSTAGHGTGRLETERIRSFPVKVPVYLEQKKIAQILSTWDKAITTTERLIDLARQQKKALIQQLLTGKKRFLGFDGEWKTYELSNLFEFKKGKGLSKDALCEDGSKCVLYGELYTKYGEVISSVVSRTKANDGLPSKTGDILIPSSTTTSGIDLANATAILEDDVLLGGDINVLRPKKKMNTEFIAYLLTHIKKYEIASRAQGITIIHLYGSDLKTISVYIPQEIGECTH